MPLINRRLDFKGGHDVSSLKLEAFMTNNSFPINQMPTMLKGYVAKMVERNNVILCDIGRSDPMARLIKMTA
jgi:hypothetical protein